MTGGVRAAVEVPVDACAADGRRARVRCEGRDPYGSTARFLVEAVQRIGGTGALAPAEGLDPESFLDAVSGPDFGWRRG